MDKTGEIIMVPDFCLLKLEIDFLSDFVLNLIGVADSFMCRKRGHKSNVFYTDMLILPFLICLTLVN